MRTIRWKRIIGIFLICVVVLVAGVWLAITGLLRNSDFRQYVIQKARQRVSEAVGAEVLVKDFGVHLSWLNPSVDMYGVQVGSAPPFTEEPLLVADRLSLAIRIDSLFQRKWYFSSIEIEHPVARIIVDEQGRNNLPVPKSQGETGLFDLGVRRVQLTNGELYYNDQKSLIEGDLRDLQAQASFDPLDRRYSGTLKYSDARLKIGNYNPVVHSLDADFDATADRLTLKRSVLINGPSQVELTATLEDYANPRLQGTYQAKLDAGDLRKILNNTTLPEGILNTAGTLQYVSDPGRSLIETVRIEGNLTSASVRIQTPKVRLPLSNVSGHYIFENGNLDGRDLRAGVFGGTFNGTLTIQDVSGAATSRLRATLRNAGLSGIQSLIPSPGPRNFVLDGRGNADVNASWNQALNDLVADADANLTASIRPMGGSREGAVPLTADIHARYNAASDQISFKDSYLRMPQTSVNLNGTVSRQAMLQVKVESSDLHEIETIANVLRPIQPLGLSGTGSFEGSVTGSTTTPEITGQLLATSFQVRGTEWAMLRTDIEASPSGLSLRNGSIRPAVRGQLGFNMMIGLMEWAFADTSPIDIRLNASQLNAVDLVRLAGSNVPVSGNLSANVSLQGSQLHPSGQGTIRLDQGSVYDEPITSANVDIQGTGDELQAKLDLRLPAGSAQGNFTVYPREKGYDGVIEANGFRLDQLHAFQARNIQVGAVLNLKASGRGTLDDPRVQLNAAIPELRIQNEVITGVSLRADIADRVANFNLDSQSRNIFVRGEGKINLRDGYDIDAKFDTSTISLQPLIAAYLPSQALNLTGQTEIHGTVRGPLKDKSRLDAHVTIPVLALDYKKTLNLAAANPIQMDYSNGLLTLQRTTIRGTGTNLELQGTIPVVGSEPAAIRAVGTIDLQIAELYDPDITTSGQVRFSIDSYGRRNPNVQGQIEIVNANFAAGNAPLGLQNGNGTLTLTNDSLRIDRFNGTTGGGTVTANGDIFYRPALRVNLAMRTTGVRLRYPQGIRETLDANLTLTGTRDAAVIRGQVGVQDISFTPDFDFADMLTEFSGPATAPAQGFAENVRLDVAVRSANDVDLVSTSLSLQGAANLQVRGTAAKPILLGRVNLNSGDVIFRGNRYVLQPSSLDFINPTETQPVVNLALDTTISDYLVHMRLNGSLDHLRTTYTSDPSLPPADIINLVVGKAIGAQVGGGTPGNFGAQSIIANAVSSQVTSRIAKVAGISQLSIDPLLGDSQKTGARITIQQRVTGNLFVTFSTDSTSTQRSTVKMEYQMTPKTSISGSRDQNGGIGMDLRRRHSW